MRDVYVNLYVSDIGLVVAGDFIEDNWADDRVSHSIASAFSIHERNTVFAVWLGSYNQHKQMYIATHVGALPADRTANDVVGDQILRGTLNEIMPTVVAYARML